jgi:hypothetical protein
MAKLVLATNDNIRSLFTDYSPGFGNLFTVNFITKGQGVEEYLRYSTLHASSISFAGAGITLKRHDTTKLFALEKYQRSDIVTITWRENKNFAVKDLHQKWLSKFYNEEKDHYISYDSKEEAQEALFKDIRVELPDNVTIRLNNILPQKVPDLNLSWESSGIITYNISYYVTSWDWSKP